MIDVLHCPTGGATSEKVCTYDRCGQCFGELEVFYEKRGLEERQYHEAMNSFRADLAASRSALGLQMAKNQS